MIQADRRRGPAGEGDPVRDASPERQQLARDNEELAAEHERKDTFIAIALTGYGDKNDQARTSAAGFHAHLVKPATASAIFDCIRNQLAKRS